MSIRGPLGLGIKKPGSAGGVISVLLFSWYFFLFIWYYLLFFVPQCFHYGIYWFYFSHFLSPIYFPSRLLVICMVSFFFLLDSLHFCVSRP